MGMRQQLAIALTQQLPDHFRVVTSMRDVAVNANEAVVQLERQSIKRLPETPLGMWQATFAIWVVVAGTGSDETEDTLDDALDDLLEVLDAQPWLLWSDAVRTAYNDDFAAAYKITATLTTKADSST